MLGKVTYFIKAFSVRSPRHQYACFVMLSGVGWILDFMVFVFLIALLSVPSEIAHLMSATTASLLVFITSRALIYNNGMINFRSLMIFFLYTEISILFWAITIGLISSFLCDVVSASSQSASITAKILVTPFSLFCNFLVSSWSSKGDAHE